MQHKPLLKINTITPETFGCLITPDSFAKVPECGSRNSNPERALWTLTNTFSYLLPEGHLQGVSAKPASNGSRGKAKNESIGIVNDNDCTARSKKVSRALLRAAGRANPPTPAPSVPRVRCAGSRPLPTPHPASARRAGCRTRSRATPRSRAGAAPARAPPPPHIPPPRAGLDDRSAQGTREGVLPPAFPKSCCYGCAPKCFL